MSRRLCIALQRQWKDDALETPDRVRERVRAREIGVRANREMTAKFGSLTPENAREAIAFQEQRIRELTKAGAGQ